MTTPRDLVRWLDDAHDALDSGRPLTVDHVTALASQPDTLRAGTRSTWWSEELARVMKQKVQDPYPGSHATNDEVRAWALRQDHYDMQIDSLTDAHADAIARAGRATAQAPAKRATQAAKRTAADYALQQIGDDAA